MHDMQERIEKIGTLTPRQLEVLRLLGEGKSHADIADLLSIERVTVQFHVTNIYLKLGIAELSRGARQRELVKFALALTQLPDHSSLPVTAPEPSLEEPSSQAIIVFRAMHSIMEDEQGLRGRAIHLAPPWPPLRTNAFLGHHIRLPWGMLLFVGVLVGLCTGAAITAVLLPPRTTAPIIDLTSLPATPGQVAVTGGIPVFSTTVTSSMAVSSTRTTVGLSAALPAPPALASRCSEASRVTAPEAARLLRSQGVSAFTVDNTKGSVLNDKVRALALDLHGLWLGYAKTDQNKAAGVGQFDGTTWADCSPAAGLPGKNINALAVDHSGRLWVATENDGVAMWDGTSWHTYTTDAGLPSNETFGLTVDQDNTIWVATLEGIARYGVESDQRWRAVYTAAVDGVLPYSNSHAIAFDRGNNIWVGHISNGVSQFSKVRGHWIHYDAQPGGLSGNNVRSIVVQDQAATPATQGVWFATADGGISRFADGHWTSYHVGDGLPSEEVEVVAIDRYQRIWAGTLGGVAYFDGNRWTQYDSLPTFSIALGVDCVGCPFGQNDHIWTGTSKGVTHARLPYPDRASIVTGVCFSSTSLTRTCPPVPPEVWITNTAVLTLTYPTILQPKETFQVEISIAPNLPYTFTVGDQLIDTDDPIEWGLLDKFEHIAVSKTVAAGEPFVFVDHNKPFLAPALEGDVAERNFVGTWRLWMHGRYTGPYIRIVAPVRRPPPPVSPTSGTSIPVVGRG